ncbi:MAG: hypothetical protein H6512_10220 [Acidimicrobiia bacterium]|nr:hypothetical protein [Acidimicrobiia bacterium]
MSSRNRSVMGHPRSFEARDARPARSPHGRYVPSAARRAIGLGTAIFVMAGVLALLGAVTSQRDLGSPESSTGAAIDATTPDDNGPVSIEGARLAGAESLLPPELATNPLLQQVLAPDAPPLCNPLGYSTCAMPYPTSLAGLPNQESPTGFTVVIPDSTLRSEVLAELPQSVHPANVLTGMSGFPTTGPVLFELPAPWDPSTLPATGGDTVVIFDAETGQRVPIMVRRNRVSAGQDANSWIVEIVPRDRFEFGRRYVAYTTTSLRRLDGSLYTRSAGMSAALQGDPNAFGAQYARDLLAEIAATGVDPASVLTMTDVRVRAESEVVDPMIARADLVRSLPHPTRNLEVKATFPEGPIGALITGEILTYDFRNPDRVFDRQVVEPRPLWVKFLMTLPTVDRSNPASVLIYGHGITTSNHSMLFWAEEAADHGFATISIDQPNHGSRIPAEGFITDLASPATISGMAGMVQQSPIDHISLVSALQTSFRGLDLYGAGGGPDGVPDLNVDDLVYSGTSMGGILGATFIALEPDLRASHLEVTGAGILDLISASTFFDELHLQDASPKSATGGEAAVLYAGLQQLIDLGDPVNFAQIYRGTDPRLGSRKVSMQYALDDAVVYNASSERLARIAGMTQTGRIFRSIPDVAQGTGFPDRNVYQSPNSQGDGISELLEPTLDHRLFALLMHVGFFHPVSTQMRGEWLTAVNPSVTAIDAPMTWQEKLAIPTIVWPFLAVFAVISKALNGPPSGALYYQGG